METCNSGYLDVPSIGAGTSNTEFEVLTGMNLDDFGAGYSNFNCLLQLPFQIIKLDTGLVHSGKNGKPNDSMVHTLTNLFHGMDLVVVAEGAETPEEVQILKEQGVDRIQGFALARPMPTDELIKFYQEHPLD